VVLGFNRTTVTGSLTEPVGTWTRQLDSRTADSGGGKEALPQDLVITPQGTQVTVAPYSAAVYIQSAA
jgi:hypothetical protein